MKRGQWFSMLNTHNTQFCLVKHNMQRVIQLLPCYYGKYWYHSSFDKLVVCCWQWIDGWVDAVQNDLLKFSTKLYPLWIADKAQSLACWAPGCPYYLPRMPSCRLALICTALFGAFSEKLHVLVEECDTWRLMACINDMPAGEREASFLPAKHCYKVGVSPQTTDQNKSSDRD